MTYDHAIVIGGSMAGLCAARVLADQFQRVTIIDRDQFPDTPEYRKGVPQGRHLHILLRRGQELLEGWFPGLREELLAESALDIEWMHDTTARMATGWLKQFHSGLYSLSVSRSLLEWAVRRRVLALGKVRILPGVTVTGLAHDPTGSRVTGVQMGETGELTADLVVDASGRGSKVVEWMAALGYGAPPETIVNSFLGYATRWYEKPVDHQGWRWMTILPVPPSLPRGGVIFEFEKGQWVCTLGGAMRDYPPTDEAGFLEFARSLAAPDIYEAIRDATPATPVYGYQRTANQWRRFERMARFPERLVVLGDAACAFNPIYGQGMTTGALAAEALGDLLRAGDLDGLSRRFQTRLAAILQGAWLLATGEDFRYPGVEGEQPTLVTRLTHRYLDRVLKRVDDETVIGAFIEVQNMLRPPTSLFRPAIMARALLGGAPRATSR